jgi:hypothetical protein
LAATKGRVACFGCSRPQVQLKIILSLICVAPL